MLVVSYIIADFHKKDNVISEPIKVHPDQLEDSFDLETATAIIWVTETFKPEQTIAQPAEQDKATGLPATISLCECHQRCEQGGPGHRVRLESRGASPGVAFWLGKHNCEMGDEFFSSSSLQTRSLDMTSIICGAENILVDGIGREGYPNWLVMNQGRVPSTNAEPVAGLNAVV
ncbi:uncharacterized protein KD926_000060 [Aspergillus affinis]|uniref:uncharacterized protein n=1 Tax=Aspergillus affinis TaxID=1070780 RepID=UPI0022FEC7E2|nr:uncharacterized protein KD926_000060 [Aspergillus affinis]KAI9037719.1 hypothetical protein KD926_000060 [Aspergillus affinis]